MTEQQKRLEGLVDLYLDGYEGKELEVRFGTKKNQRISKIDFDNVIKKLLSVGFYGPRVPSSTLKMNIEYTDSRTGELKMTSTRTEVNGIENIQKYCKTNSLVDPNTGYIYENYGIAFTKKQPVFRTSNEKVHPVDYDDFNFRVSLQQDVNIGLQDPAIKKTISEWKNTKKTFRYVTRYTFSHHDFPFRVDCSIVKSSKIVHRKLLPVYNINDSHVFNNDESYEIELEYIGTNLGRNDIIKQLKKQSMLVLTGLQRTNFPIGNAEIMDVHKNYLSIVHGKETDREIKGKDFIGPNSITLEIDNIKANREDLNVANIRDNYTVTDKADGLRKLLFINMRGKIYLIDTNMNVQFTGAITKDSRYYNSIADGEHIINDKVGNYINLYAAFDIYFINGKDYRKLPFKVTIKEKKDCRLDWLESFVKELSPLSITGKETTPIRIQCKKFHYATGKDDMPSIFDGCNEILSQINIGLTEYETDGLIFTPMYRGVGGNDTREVAPLHKITWKESFKWKPPHFNSIDFLVTTTKQENGIDVISTIFQDGQNLENAQSLTQYKTFVLRVGYSDKDHGFINPCQNLLDDDIPNRSSQYEKDKSTYKPIPFYPTNPTDNKASICNIMINSNASVSGELLCLAESGDIIEDNMIVEFSYKRDDKEGWRWKPLRVRYDKTEAHRRGKPQYGNAYDVANSIWNSIHHPVDEEMVKTGKNIPELLGDDDVYYKKNTSYNTGNLRDFHNQYVKRKLILSATDYDNTLVDLACGKGGDLPKWIKAHLSFVLGIDLSRDNIENRLDGACARYLRYRQKYASVPAALFIQGDSSRNLKSGEGIATDKGREIMNAIFGKGAKDEKKLGQGVINQFGKVADGFNVVSCQFAIHYFCENEQTFANFLKNVAQTCKLDGYFIGTSYDGKTVFNRLKTVKQNEAQILKNGNNKIWEITKLYDNDEFPDNIVSLGYGIDVYQESINKITKEYLVNYDYLFQVLADFGFVLLSLDEAENIGLPNSTGMFRELYNSMESEVKRFPETKEDYGNALNMSPEEKTISFLNRYFIVKKVREVNLDDINLLDELKTIEQLENKQTLEVQQVAQEVVNETKKKIKKSNKKLTIQ